MPRVTSQGTFARDMTVACDGCDAGYFWIDCFLFDHGGCSNEEGTFVAPVSRANMRAAFYIARRALLYSLSGGTFAALQW